MTGRTASFPAACLAALAASAPAMAQDNSITVNARDPSAASFAAFDAACGRLARGEAMATAAEAQGWQRITAQAGSEPLHMHYFAARAMGGSLDRRPFRHWTLIKRINDRTAALLISEHGADGLQCRLVDPELGRAPARATISGWAGKPATARSQGPGAVAERWVPGAKRGQGASGYRFVTASSPARRLRPGRGLIIEASRKADAELATILLPDGARTGPEWLQPLPPRADEGQAQ